MNFAIREGERVAARKGGRASCPNCGKEVIAKCGEIVVHHWAHRVRDCDPWAEPMSEWHWRWQSIFQSRFVEVPLGASPGERAPHRADVRLPNGRVIEFQRSSISVGEIRKREEFYTRRMTWVFDASKWLPRIEWYWSGDGTFTIEWKRDRPSHRALRARVIWDLGKGFLLVRNDPNPRSPCPRLIHISELVRTDAREALRPDWARRFSALPWDPAESIRSRIAYTVRKYEDDNSRLFRRTGLTRRLLADATDWWEYDPRPVQGMIEGVLG